MPTCGQFLVDIQAKEFIEKDPDTVRRSLPFLSRAARRLKGALFLEDENDIMNVTGEQEGLAQARE